ncbi:unnamed protein product [Amaranthus hypochondriacus]
MNRLSRLVNPFNSLDSTLFITPINRNLNLTFNFQSQSQSCKLCQFPRKLTPVSISLHRGMDSNFPENLSSSAIDDFITVENPENEEESSSSLSSSALANDPSNVVTDVVNEDDCFDDETERISGRQSEEKIFLPEDLLKSVVVLSCDNVHGHTCDVYLVGTAHVSQESCREVQAVIDYLKPQVVFLELCSSRVNILTLRDLKVPTMKEMIDMLKKKHNIFGILYGWFLAKVGDTLEVLPGSEFRVAFEEAMKHGCKVILGDRPVQITLQRTWRKMPFWHKIKLVYSLLFQAMFLPSPDDLNKMLKEMNDVDMLTLVIQEMSKEFPVLLETLVHERDRYMSSTLLRVAREHTSVVAVVGRGHLQGIKRNWMQPVEANELLEIPSSRPVFSVVKVLTAVGIAVAGTAIVSGIYIASKKQS